MYKKRLTTVISLISLCLMVSFEVKANVYNSTVTSFNPLNWQLTGTSTISVDYATLMYYNPNFALTIKLTSANGQILSSTGVIFAGGSPTASASTSVYSQANTTYFVSASHWLDCRNPVGGYWGDDLGYGPKSPSPTTYNGSEFTVVPTGAALLYSVREIYLGHTNGIFTTPAYNGAAMIDAVGFKGDVQRPGNQMTITARIVLTQIPPANAKANIRLKSDLENPGAIIASINNVSLTYPVTTIPNIPGNLGVEPSYGHITNVFEQFAWEISYNGGASWQSIGESWHLFAWIFRNPLAITPAAPVFRDVKDIDYPLIYDYAVATGTGFAYWSVSENEAITGLTNSVYSTTTYNPQLGGIQRHPLEYLYGVCLCADFANLTRGLARSIGVAAETTYIWGGNPTAPITSNWFKYIVSPTTEGAATMKITRPQHRDHNPPSNSLPANPFFIYHAVTKWIPPNRYFDAAYGFSDASIDLIQSISYPSATCNGISNVNRVLSSSLQSGGLFTNENPPGVFPPGGGIDFSVIPTYCP